jgi:hypothetical protein
MWRVGFLGRFPARKPESFGFRTKNKLILYKNLIFSLLATKGKHTRIKMREGRENLGVIIRSGASGVDFTLSAGGSLVLE